MRAVCGTQAPESPRILPLEKLLNGNLDSSQLCDPVGRRAAISSSPQDFFAPTYIDLHATQQPVFLECNLMDWALNVLI